MKLHLLVTKLLEKGVLFSVNTSFLSHLRLNIEFPNTTDFISLGIPSSRKIFALNELKIQFIVRNIRFCSLHVNKLFRCVLRILKKFISYKPCRLNLNNKSVGLFIVERELKFALYETLKLFKLPHFYPLIEVECNQQVSILQANSKDRSESKSRTKRVLSFLNCY